MIGVVVFVTAACGSAVGTDEDSATAVDRRWESVRDDPAALHELLQRMPKGADLHNHLGGAVSTESLIRYAVEGGLCIDTATYVAVDGPCVAGSRPAADTRGDAAFARSVLAAWSMEGFVPGPDASGYDHFFATFARFDRATVGREADMLAEIMDDAAEHGLSHVETMVFPDLDALAGAPGTPPPPPVDDTDSGFAALREYLLAGDDMRLVVATATDTADRQIADARRLLGCDTPQARPGCGTSVGLVTQVDRTVDPFLVFAQLVLGLELGAAGGRFVGLNMVGPEADPVALRDRELHMRMVDHLRPFRPAVGVALHAGELDDRLVRSATPAGHVRDAVRVAGADRIGHGVTLPREPDAEATATAMRERGIALEALLTSNAQAIGVQGGEHPIGWYLQRGVPVVLGTDDPGVSRSAVTDEYLRGVRDHGLGYSELRTIARASLTHAFVPGRGLWDGPRTVPECADEVPGAGSPGRACAAYLRDDPKASLQWDLEGRLANYEADAVRSGG